MFVLPSLPLCMNPLKLTWFAGRLEFIANAPTLEVFKLNNNGMGPAGGAMIAGALLGNAQKAEKEGRKSSLRVLVCGTSNRFLPFSYGDEYSLLRRSQVGIDSRTALPRPSLPPTPRSAHFAKFACLKTESGWRVSRRSSAV